MMFSEDRAGMEKGKHHLSQEEIKHIPKQQHVKNYKATEQLGIKQRILVKYRCAKGVQRREPEEGWIASREVRRPEQGMCGQRVA